MIVGTDQVQPAASSAASASPSPPSWWLQHLARVGWVRAMAIHAAFDVCGVTDSIKLRWRTPPHPRKAGKTQRQQREQQVAHAQPQTNPRTLSVQRKRVPPGSRRCCSIAAGTCAPRGRRGCRSHRASSKSMNSAKSRTGTGRTPRGGHQAFKDTCPGPPAAPPSPRRQRHQNHHAQHAQQEHPTVASQILTKSIVHPPRLPASGLCAQVGAQHQQALVVVFQPNEAQAATAPRPAADKAHSASGSAGMALPFSSPSGWRRPGPGPARGPQRSRTPPQSTPTQWQTPANWLYTSRQLTANRGRSPRQRVAQPKPHGAGPQVGAPGSLRRHLAAARLPQPVSCPVSTAML